MNRIRTNVVAAAALMASTAPCFADGGDTYAAQNGQLLIPSITVENTKYTNVVITIGSIVSVGGSSPVCIAPQVLINGVCAVPKMTIIPGPGSVPVPAPAPADVHEGGLIWVMGLSTSSTYAQASTLCGGTTYINGQGGWRLPTQQELYALYTSGTISGQVGALGFTWSSTPNGVGNHYAIDLNDGTVFPFIDTTSSNVTCVR